MRQGQTAANDLYAYCLRRALPNLSQSYSMVRHDTLALDLKLQQIL